MGPVTIILLVALFFILIFALSGLKIVQQSETMVIERLGKYSRTLHSGISIIWPVIDKPRAIAWKYTIEDYQGNIRSMYRFKSKIDMRETVYDFPKQNVITKDNVLVQINAMIYYQITDPVKSVYEIENLPQAIEKLTQTTLRNIIGELDLDQTLVSRDVINSKLRAILDEASNKWGVKVNRVELQDINPPADIRQAMEKQMKAERDRRAKILEAEGLKTSQILEAEGIREAKINQAEGEKQSQILRATGEAEARIRVAQAEAEAIGKIKAAIGDTSNPVNYLVALKYIEALKEMTSGNESKTVFIPYEATGILSSIGGIKEMLGK